MSGGPKRRTVEQMRSELQPGDTVSVEFTGTWDPAGGGTVRFDQVDVDGVIFRLPPQALVTKHSKKPGPDARS